MHEIPNDLRRRLEQFGQEHVLSGWESLTVDERRRLVDQLAALDLEQLQRLHAGRHVKNSIPDLSRLAPLPRPAESAADLERFRRVGDEALRAGAVAYLVVAGGQGTRLGFDYPKGMYPIGPVSGKSLYQLHAEKVLALRRRYQSALPLLVMTSPATHDETVRFFGWYDQFGLGDTVRFFCQGTMPALDFETGKLLMDSPGSLGLSPDGHGGVLAALRDAGLFDFLSEQGARTIFYFQVDNPLTNLGDLQFLGRHVAHRAEASSKILPKKHPKEKMGNFVLVDGRCSIIEYSDLPDDWTTLQVGDQEPGVRGQESGELFFWGGNTAIHVFDVDFLRRMSEAGDAIPWHLAKKKAPFLGPGGQLVAPAQENALKFEKFIFDVLPLAERWTVAATERAVEFAPLKNASGDDSIDTARSALFDLAATWLEQAGGVVPRDAHGKAAVPLEISPLFALDADELAAKIKRGLRIEEATYFE
ncbi:MAG: UTP--glucose-1-phosphate uridylyltransferase [Gemmataceae bacterium]|nr:UTP--glucose-1-phosphate uridylyltransferase [Gemmataceae bacterium]